MLPLLFLPNELLEDIVSTLSDRATLLALAQTCSRLQPFAEAQLFKRVIVHDGPSVVRLARDLEQPPWRMKAVKNLEVTPTMHSWPRGIALMPELVGRLVRLESLKVESPLIMSGEKPSWWADGIMLEYMDLFAGNGMLECLTSFTLHSHGVNNRFYNVREVLPVFLSPTLRHLHLSCVDLSYATETFAALGSEAQVAHTPLETLILQRCQVSSSHLDDFHVILSRPRALRSLTVLLDTDFGQSGTESGTQLASHRAQAAAIVRAIQQHSDSLQYLRYAHRPTHRPARGSPQHLKANLVFATSTLDQFSLGLSTFHRLHTLHVDYRSNLTDLLFVKGLAPPNLRSLGLTGLMFEYELCWAYLPDLVSAIASVTPFAHLRLHTRPDGRALADVSRMFTTTSRHYPYHNIPQLRDALLSLVDTLHAGKSMKLVSSRFERQRSGFHPPFLYGERLPDEAVIFDSEKCSSEEGDKDQRFKVEKYTPEEVEVSGWRGPFSALGNSFWKD